MFWFLYGLVLVGVVCCCEEFIIIRWGAEDTSKRNPGYRVSGYPSTPLSQMKVQHSQHKLISDLSPVGSGINRCFKLSNYLGDTIVVTVIGVDIQPGSSPNSRRQPLYSAVVLRNGEIIASFEDVELYRLLRLVLEYHVDIIAVDNIYELAPSENELRRIFELLPGNVKVVQVTGPPNDARDVNSVARELGIDTVIETPLKTAYINALAAYRGIGYEVRLFAEKTRIVVTKGRSVTQGGMSRDRFLRCIRASIAQATKEIKRILDENKLDYDMVIKRSKGGLEKSVFIVYAPRESLYGLIKPLKYKNVKIIIKPYASRKSIEPVSDQARKPVIVGVDPGMSIGVSVLTLDGEPVLITSMKSPDRDEIVNLISRIGKPVVVATDVSKPPETVVKLASMLNAVLYVPEQDITIDEKNRIAREYSEKYVVNIPDSHTRDALAAAVKAYNNYKATIEEVKSKLANVKKVDRYQLIAEIIRGKPFSEVLEEHFKRSIPKIPPVVEEKMKPTTTPVCEKLSEKVNTLEALVRKLLDEIERKDLYIKDLELELKLTRSRKPGIEDYERKISALQNELEALRRKIEDKDNVIRELYEKLLQLEEHVVKLGRGDLVMIPKVSTVRREGGLVNRGVYMEKVLEISSELKNILTSGRGFIVSPVVAVDPLKERIPVVKPEIIYDLGDYVIVEKEVIEKANELWRKIDELIELERHERILRMIEEYQRSRKNS